MNSMLSRLLITAIIRNKLKPFKNCDMRIQSTIELFDPGVMQLARYLNFFASNNARK